MKYEHIDVTEEMKRETLERTDKTIEACKETNYKMSSKENTYKGFLGEHIFHIWLKNNKIPHVWLRSYGAPDDGDFKFENGKVLDVKSGHRMIHIARLDPNEWCMEIKESQLNYKTYDLYAHVILNANLTRGFVIGYTKTPKAKTPVKDLIPIEHLKQEL